VQAHDQKLTRRTPAAGEITTYRRADGEPIDGYMVGWTTTLGGLEFGEPTEIVEEVWVLKSERCFTLPTCRQCEEPATHWGLCETHAREDDPTTFEEAR
jgi:hypothetical protein